MYPDSWHSLLREVGELRLLLTAALSSFHFLWHLQTENGHSFSRGSTLEIRHRMDNFGLESIVESFSFLRTFRRLFLSRNILTFPTAEGSHLPVWLKPGCLGVLALINFEWQRKYMLQAGKGRELLMGEESPLGLTLACGLRWGLLRGICSVSSGQ